MATLAAEKSWTDRDAATGVYARKVLAYVDAIKETVERAKAPGFDASGWDEVAAMLDTEKFRRVGNDKAEMGWPVYRDLLMQWGTTTEFWSEFRRISEVGSRVFLELTEHNRPVGGEDVVVHSCTVYEFDEAGKLVHLDIYLQHD
ncbi:hypothetical protein B2G71_06745 [Novosphingobium sp. PC22D]|uniref:hypothetical protein n=1 Tax=Novosphingobium sp. PC22D TaxID=1962403 RepID=UPI000BF0ECB0|nr:hypothetical protein [Novosphingobium sp. PC22D]PEQ13146.1 hypothetical protein B2G71_06745 [Novosphingobium sp. PC22D]